MATYEAHANVVRKVAGPAADLLDLVWNRMSTLDRDATSDSVAGHVNELLVFALQRLPEFAEDLARTVALVYELSPSGERFVQDPIRYDGIVDRALFLDSDGHLVSVKDPILVWTKDSPSVLDMQSYRSYEILTGPQTGSSFYPSQRPLGAPIYKPGVIAQWYRTAGAEHAPATAAEAVQTPIPGIVFLCHSSENKPAIRDLYVRLLQDGFDPWLDEERLLPGQDWNLEIESAVKEAAAIVVCLSAISVTKRGYVQREIKRALDVAQELPEGSIFIIPARLEQVEVPSSLKKWQWVNLFDSDGYEKLRKALTTALAV